MQWVTASDLDRWAKGNRDAQGYLPALLRRLIRATAGEIRFLDFRSGDSVQLSGWDGQVESAEGGEYVPTGWSGWELSCEDQPKGKADDDYGKRTKAPDSLTPGNSEFIFVTPRRWPAKEAWARQKTDEHRWRGVRAYDADDLEQWIETAPAVGAWLAKRIGKLPPGVQALEDWWQDWNVATDPPMSPELLVGSREREASGLLSALEGEPCVKAVEAEDPDEVKAFAAAVIERLPQEKAEALWARAIILGSRAALDEIAWTAAPLLVVLSEPCFPQPCDTTHHVMVPFERGKFAGPPDMTLPPLPVSHLEAALLSVGLSPERSQKAALEASGSLRSVRARLAIRPVPLPALPAAQEAGPAPSETGLRVPQSRGDEAPHGPAIPLALMLARSWDGSRDGDRNVLARLARQDYPDFEQGVQHLAVEPGSLVKQIGPIWRLSDSPDAFKAAAKYATRSGLEVYRDSAIEVLTERHPKRDLEPEKRWMAAAYGKERNFSGELRNGIAESLALISVFGTQVNAGMLGLGDSVVSRLLVKADKERWIALADVLPRLAEAAPDPFLSALERSLAENPPPVLALFEEEPGPLTPHSNHTGLLWALERLAWCPQFMPRAALILAELTERDPGGRLGNRPAASLRNIFLPWCPQTGTISDQRRQVIDIITQRMPAAGWQLLLSLAPRFHDFCMPSAKPEWLSVEEPPPVTQGDLIEWDEYVGKALLASVGTDGARWRELLGALAEFPRAMREAIRSQLAATAGAIQERREDLWAGLRILISRHRQFSAAQWAIPGDEIDSLEAIYDSIAPSDPVERLAWSFDPDPPQLQPPTNPADIAARDARAKEIRLKALGEISGTLGWDGIQRLCHLAPRAAWVGATLADSLDRDDYDRHLLDAGLGSAGGPMREAARGYVVQRFCRDGWDWADSLLSEAGRGAWPLGKMIDLLLGLPLSQDTWDRVAGLGAEHEAEYWSQVHVLGMTAGDFSVERLLAAGRPLEAFAVAGSQPSAVAPDLCARVIEMAPRALAAHGTRLDAMFPWYAERLFERLDQAGIDKVAIAKLEWPYLGLFSHWKRPSSAFHQALAGNPELFTEMVKWHCKPDNDSGEGPPLDDPEVQARAHAAWQLLRSWRGMPGLEDSGQFDGNSLKAWVERARALCGQSGRGSIGDQQIGAVLQRSPVGADGTWPAEAVREIVETSQSGSLELGLQLAIENSRGVTTRAPGDGGAPERALAAQYRDRAEAIRYSAPRTAAVLDRVAADYEDLARRHDEMDERHGFT